MPRETRKKTILLVDDEIPVAREEERIIRGFGYDVIVKQSGDEAVKAAAGTGVDLVLMDIDLGGGAGGPEAARRILARRQVPVIFLASGAERDPVELVRGITRYGFVIKNAGDFVLRSSIETAFELFEANEKTRESENRYRSLFMNLDAGVVVHGPDTSIIMNNPRASELLGLSDDQMKGRLAADPRWSFIGEDHAPMPLEEYPVNRIVATGKPVQNQTVGVNRAGSGSTTWLMVNGFPVTDSRGKLSEILITYMDITEHKRTGENLKFSEEKFFKSFMTSPAALCIARLKDYKIIEINDTLIKRTGFTREEIIDKTAPELFVWDNPADRQEVVKALLAEGKITGKEYTFRMKDQSIVIGEYSAFIITIGGEKHILVTILDITGRKRVEEKIRALLSEKELLLREVHHRIKNNMGTMISLLSLQAGMLKEQDTVNALLEARGRIQSMSVLYDTLYQTENVRQMSIGHYLVPLVERIVSLFPISAAVTIEKQIENFALEVKTLLSLGIIVNELVTNAMKYAFAGRESGVITVSTSKKENRATLVIGDNGTGIPESIDIEHSAGFGLSLVGILMKQINGTVAIERSGGTRFVITFPVPS